MLVWPPRFLEVPVVLVGPMLAACATAAFVGGRDSRLAVGRTPQAGATAPAPSAPDPGAVSTDIGPTLAAASWMVAKSMPSSCAHRSSGAAIGRPRSGSCQVPTETAYRTDVRENRECYRLRPDGPAGAQRRPEQNVAPKVSSVRRAADGQQPTAVGISTTLREA